MALQKPYDLSRLVRRGCSPRVLDLCSLHERYPDLDESSAPLFFSPRLNRCFVVKHNLRRHEFHLANTRRPIATKLVLPIDLSDLRAGAFWLFIESGDMESRLVEFLGRLGGAGDQVFEADLETLKLLSSSPSFDPFLLSARFSGRRIDQRFFAMSELDERVLRKYVLEHMDQISRLALGREKASKRSERLAAVLFGEAESQARDALREALRMSDEEFEQGVYGWKGMLYYDWSAGKLTGGLTRFLSDLADLEIMDRQYRHRPLQPVLGRLRQGVKSRWDELVASRHRYFDAVGAFMNEGDALAMKDFLLQVPGLFTKIGDDMAALTHMTSYWDYWKDRNETRQVSHEEALAILPDLAGAVVRESELSQSAWSRSVSARLFGSVQHAVDPARAAE